MRTASTQSANSVSRMQLLRGDFRGRELPLRPPWAIAESLFTEICTRCGDCIAHCPEKLITSGRGGYPVVDFSHGECTFCEACLDHCQPQALLKTDQPPWQLKAVLDQHRCIAFTGVECRSCHDPCAAQAIRLLPRRGGISQPQLDTGLCSGCGACVAPCPTAAIRIQINHNRKHSEVAT